MAAIGLPGMLPAQNKCTKLAVSRLSEMQSYDWYFEAAEGLMREIDIEP